MILDRSTQISPLSTRGRLVFWLWIGLVLFAGSRNSFAHIPTDLVGTQVKLVFFEDRVQLVLDIGYRGTWAQAEMIRMDANDDSSVDKEEADVYAEVLWKKKILREGSDKGPTVQVKIDGVPVPLKLKATEHEELVGRIFPAPFTIYYTCDLPMPGGEVEPETMHEIEILDIVTKGEVDDKPDYLVPFSGHGNAPDQLRFSPEFVEPVKQKIALDGFGDQWVAQNTETLKMRFEFARVLGAKPPVEAKTGTRGAEESSDANAPPPVQRDALRLTQAFLDLSGAGFWETILILLMAVAWGAGHAFTPGHGSMMLASYLVGTEGRVKEVFVLGIATTITHTLVAFGLGFVILLVAHHYATTSEGAIANRVMLVCMVASGFLLTIMGLVIFFRRSRTHAKPTSEEDRASSSSGADESSGSPRPSLRELIVLGFSGGLLPCPAAFTIILLGLHYPQHLVFAIVLLVAFGVGFGGALILTGSIFATGKVLAPGKRLEGGVFFQEAAFLKTKFRPETLARADRTAAKLVRALPSASSLFVAGLGTFFVVRSITSHPAETRAILDSLGL